MNGSLSLVCARVNGRSALTTIRFEGLARASRALRGPNGAVNAIASTLGPGLLAGDRMTTDISVGSAATLVLASQMATPVFASPLNGDRSLHSRTQGSSRVAAGATLYVLGEPLLLAPGAIHEAFAEADVGGDGFALFADIVVLGAGAEFRARTTVRIDGRLAIRDACDLAGTKSDRAFLTVIATSPDMALRLVLTSAFAEILEPETTVRAGIGETGGAVVVRARASGAWALQRLLERIAAAALDARDRTKEARRPESERSA